jgi:O-antigen biosynthesis protein WbqP
MKRFFDFFLALILSFLLIWLIILVAIVVRLSSRGPVLYWSSRIGLNNKLFEMPKFRTMQEQTPVLATHLMTNPKAYLSPVGAFLRRFSLDELPQLFSILKGDMSFVGPRPALFNQNDLIALRTEKGIDKLVPGVTGWSQVNGRDDLSITEKVDLDLEYLIRHSFWFDLHIIWITFLKVLRSEGVSH